MRTIWFAYRACCTARSAANESVAPLDVRELSFFFAPEEMAGWLRQVAKEFGLWVVLKVWPGGPAQVDATSVSETLFLTEFEAVPRLYLGCQEPPAWTQDGGRRELRFAHSYAVSCTPSVVTSEGTVLLLGRIAILPLSAYERADAAKRLLSLYRSLCKGLAAAAAPGRRIVQRTSLGETKVWPRMLVGRVAAQRPYCLKQFARGAVEFSVE